MPTGLSKHDEEYMKEAQPILEGLLKELKAKGCIKTKKELSNDKQSLSQVLVLINRVNRHVATVNKLTAVISTKVNAIALSLNDVGVKFNPTDVFEIWVYEVFSSFLDCTELLLKYLLIAIPPRKPFRNNMTLGQLIGTLRSTCPLYGDKLADQIDEVLRNAIAHGNYWIQRNKNRPPSLFYCEQFGWVPIVEPLDNVIVRMRNHNLLGFCLIQTMENVGRGLLG
jgi:hypothetical protein